MCYISSLCLLLCALLSTISSAFSHTAHAGSTAPAVTDPSTGVTFRGISNNSIESFLNIKFGQDTGGNARFTIPKPYTYLNNSIVNASTSGAACPQAKTPIPGIPVFSNVTNISEDCLTLRIDRHENATSASRLPVMVYIYGGGYTSGQIYDITYDPMNLLLNAVHANTPVLYAAVNYRVNMFGFASSEALAEEDSLNLGLLDQRLGLEWIQKNIHLFGGDPDNITIFGESAGALSIGLQLVAYGGQKPYPFHRAITQSGATTGNIGATGNLSTLHTAQVALLTNCTSANSTEELSCLRKLPFETLLDIVVKYEFEVNPLGGFLVFSPIVSHNKPDSILPSAPSKLLRSGHFAYNTSLITGWNENDGSIFVPKNITTPKEVVKAVTSGTMNSLTLSSSTITAMLDLYPVDSFAADPSENISAEYFRAAQIARDILFTCPSLFMVQAMANYSSPGTTNRLFAFNESLFEPLYAKVHDEYLGVSHGSDIAFVFDSVSTTAGVNTQEISLGRQVSGSWTHFATTGTPVSSNGNLTLPDWPRAYASGRDQDRLSIEVIGGPHSGPTSISMKQSGGALDTEDLLRRCSFWNSEAVAAQLHV